MPKNHLGVVQKLFGYDDWANRAHLDSFRKIEASGKVVPEHALKMFAHIVATKRLYYARAFPEAPTDIGFYPVLDTNGCAKLLDEAAKFWDAKLASFNDRQLDAVVTYTNLKGATYKRTVRAIVQHLLLHSAHHRGQVAMTLRQAGFEPASADFIYSPMAEME